MNVSCYPSLGNQLAYDPNSGLPQTTSILAIFLCLRFQPLRLVTLDTNPLHTHIPIYASISFPPLPLFFTASLECSIAHRTI